jgi:plasmid maintenance system antidote protein VapI
MPSYMRVGIAIRQEDGGRDQIDARAAVEVGEADASRLVVGKNVTGEYLLRLVGRRDKRYETWSSMDEDWSLSIECNDVVVAGKCSSSHIGSEHPSI